MIPNHSNLIMGFLGSLMQGAIPAIILGVFVNGRINEVDEKNKKLTVVEQLVKFHPRIQIAKQPVEHPKTGLFTLTYRIRNSGEFPVDIGAITSMVTANDPSEDSSNLCEDSVFCTIHQKEIPGDQLQPGEEQPISFQYMFNKLSALDTAYCSIRFSQKLDGKVSQYLLENFDATVTFLTQPKDRPMLQIILPNEATDEAKASAKKRKEG